MGEIHDLALTLDTVDPSTLTKDTVFRMASELFRRISVVALSIESLSAKDREDVAASLQTMQREAAVMLADILERHPAGEEADPGMIRFLESVNLMYGPLPEGLLPTSGSKRGKAKKASTPKNNQTAT